VDRCRFLQNVPVSHDTPQTLAANRKLERMRLTLIGYRGSGKTSVAKALANRLGWSCVDADQVIEEQAGCTIREIFERHGEPYFRDLEERVLAELLGNGGAESAEESGSRENRVISAGGGAILREATRQRMRNSGPVIWLEASPAELIRRISADTASQTQRPELTNQGLLGEVATVLENRLPLYQETATERISTEGKSPAEIADQILAQMNLAGGTSSW